MPTPSLFDLTGNHWQAHGATVRHHARGDATRLGGAGLDVFSYFAAKGCACSVAPHVVLTSDTGPFALRLDLRPEDALDLAEALVEAAGRAVEVRDALAMGGAK